LRASYAQFIVAILVYFMNRLILFPNELSSKSYIKLSDRRAEHIRSTLRAEKGSEIRFGLVNGPIGKASLIEDDGVTIQLSLEYSNEAPARFKPCTLVLALPRPKMARRLIQSICALGVEELHLINSYKVDKSYWQSHYLSEEALAEQLVLGMEQSGSTLMPTITKHTKFRPFVEDTFPAICSGKMSLLAHPYSQDSCPIDLNQPSVLVIGPEGGFTEFEVNLLSQNGARPVHIGARILRVETAVPAIIGRLYI